MVLQNIVFPKAGICSRNEMYFRCDPKRVRYIETQEKIVFDKKGITWFDTYFNGFSIEKWMKYTSIKNVNLVLELKGKFQIRLCSKEKIHNNISEKILSIAGFDSNERKSITIPFCSYDKKGMFFFSLEALENDAEFYGGCFMSDIPDDQLVDVNLAVNICTFKREVFVERNLRIFSEDILNNPANPLSEHLHIFISDNGKTLDIDSLANDKIHIVQNKNVGGAGGFTRGLLEIMDCNSFNATHALFMDDDVMISSESLYRTFAVLRCRKEQYSNLFIGGAMLRLDQQSVQVESGASWNAGNLVSNKCGLDLESVDACLYNEVEEYTEFNAWWYCCMPMCLVNSENLPLPIFIRGDDLEYGLRNMNDLMLMNGICVWHEPFENKYSSFLSYYILRNMLYDNALHFRNYSKMRLISRMSNMVLHELMMYRYKNVDLIFRGVNDFLKGTDFLLNTDGEKLHQEIMASGYRASELKDLDMAFSYPEYESSFRENDGGLRKKLRILGFNGLFRKANRTTIVSMAQCRPINFHRASRVMQYDVTSKKAFITEKSISKTIRGLFRLIWQSLLVYIKFDKAFAQFGNDAQKVQTKQFWTKYLGL